MFCMIGELQTQQTFSGGELVEWFFATSFFCSLLIVGTDLELFRKAMAAAAGFYKLSLSVPRPSIVAQKPRFPYCHSGESSFLLPPSPPEKREKGKDNGKEHSVWPMPGLTTPSPQPPLMRNQTPLPPNVSDKDVGPNTISDTFRARTLHHPCALKME